MPGPKPKPFTPLSTAKGAATALMRCYRERAGEEALFRALLAERDLNAEKARFWIGVYGHVAEKR